MMVYLRFTYLVEWAKEDSLLLIKIHTDLLKRYSWIILCGYAVRRRRLSDGDGGGLISMHRAVLGITGEVHVDHISGNKLDNRRLNLRETNSLGNNKNRPGTSKTGYKGVYFEKKCSKPYCAQIMSNGKRFRLGYFNTPEEAYSAYCKAAHKLHGDFSNTKHVSDT